MRKRRDPGPSTLQALRDRMAAEVARRDPEISPRVIAILRDVPRHLFVPDVDVTTAHENRALGIGRAQTISQPSVVAIMTDALCLTGTQRVLEIGTGSGYQTALLARMAAAVYSIEAIADLAERARVLLERLGHVDVHLRRGDGSAGWPEEAPFDGILVTAAPRAVPLRLLEQLGSTGILVAPVGSEQQRLHRWRRRGDHFDHDDLGAVRFVPLVTDPGEAL